MNSKITFTDIMQLDGIMLRHIEATVTEVGAIVSLVTTSNTDAELAIDRFSIDMLWDQIADVDHLADVFGHEQVRTFRLIVTMLGKLYAQNEVLKEIMKS